MFIHGACGLGMGWYRPAVSYCTSLSHLPASPWPLRYKTSPNPKGSEMLSLTAPMNSTEEFAKKFLNLITCTQLHGLRTEW